MCRSNGIKNIIGLMCIPPINESPTKHYQIISDLTKEFGLGRPSIGMSGDYLQALDFDPQYIYINNISGQLPTRTIPNLTDIGPNEWFY